jgi:hypothetical protein
MNNFRPIDRDIDFLLLPLVQDWMPAGHLARFVAEVVEGLDLSKLKRAYGGCGSAAYHPATLLSLFIYDNVTGCFSSRTIKQATYDVPDGMSVPEELKRRGDRLAATAAAKAKIEVRAAERFGREQVNDEAKRTAATGKQVGGKVPPTADTGSTPGRPAQLHRRGLAHHVGRWRHL